MKKYKIIFLFLIHSLVLKGAPEKAFSKFEAIVQIIRNTNQTHLHDYWNVGTGFNLSYETPFYLGEISAGCSYLPYKSKKYKKPDFQSYFIYLAWLYDMKLFDKMTISPGIKFGNYMMNFDIVSEHVKFESEVSFESFCRINYRINRLTKVNLEIGKEIVYTYKLLSFTLLKAGFGFTLEKPEWFEEFFR